MDREKNWASTIHTENNKRKVNHDKEENHIRSNIIIIIIILIKKEQSLFANW